MRTTVTLDDDVYQAIATLSQTSGRSLGKVLSEVARHGLKPRPAFSKKKKGLPTFELSPDAPLIPGNRVQEAWNEEGLG